MLLCSTEGWAQRRREEPQANPQFTEGAADASEGGSPAENASGEPVSQEESSTAEDSTQGVQIGAASSARPAPAAPVSPLETRVSVRVKGAPLATFLDTISAQARVNFIITEGLEAKQVTAFLQNVTVREALQILLEIKGLTYQQIGKSNTYAITPRSKTAEAVITRIYTLSYVPLISIDSGAGTISSGGGAPAATASAESGVAIINVIKSVLSKLGQVALEPRTNSIIVTDIPEVFPQVEQIITELDKKAPQVMIEAQIVEIDSNRSRNLGFEWGGSNGELAAFGMGSRQTTFPMTMNANMGKTRFFNPLAPAALNTLDAGQTQSASSTPGETTLPVTAITPSIFDLSQLRIVLRALVSRSEARFLGKPKILTLNNKSAVIQISNNQAISRQSQSTSVGSSGASTISSAERAQTGLTLRVTPQVNKEGYITMLVQPSFTDVALSEISVPSNPTFDTITRAASTLVRVKNGQTLVLGGLLNSNETKVIRKVPFLGYIPLLGWLFTTSSTVRRNSDLVIFITPTIVSD